jgi:hypothetical protein
MKDALARSVRENFLNIDVLCTVSSCAFSPEKRFAHSDLRLKSPRFGKHNRRLDSPRRQTAQFYLVAFILNERQSPMVN